MKVPEEKQGRGRWGNYAVYSGIGFQMIAIIGAFTFAGHYLDQSTGSSQPIWTAILALIGVCISIYTTIKMVIGRRPGKGRDD